MPPKKVSAKSGEGSQKRAMTPDIKCEVNKHGDGVRIVIIPDEIVPLGEAIYTKGLDFSEDEIDDLVEEHGEELTTEELKDLQQEQQSEVVKAWEEETVEEEEKMIATKDMKEMLSMWEKIREFIEKNHPEKVATVRAADLFNDTCLTHFRKILKGRSKQTSLERFLIKRPLRDESDTSRTTVKKRRLSESENEPEVESVIDEKDDDEGGGEEES